MTTERQLLSMDSELNEVEEREHLLADNYTGNIFTDTVTMLVKRHIY